MTSGIFSLVICYFRDEYSDDGDDYDDADVETDEYGHHSLSRFLMQQEFESASTTLEDNKRVIDKLTEDARLSKSQTSELSSQLKESKALIQKHLKEYEALFTKSAKVGVSASVVLSSAMRYLIRYLFAVVLSELDYIK